MIKAYIVQNCHANFPTTSEEWDVVINEIKEVDPDKIVVFSANEVAIEEMYGMFFDKIVPYLKETNKIVNVITPHLDGEEIRYNIVTERTYGNIQSVFGSFLQNTMRDPTYDIGSRIAPDHTRRQRLTHLYTCYNVRSTVHRGMMVDYLARDGLLPKGVVTYHQPEMYNWLWHDGKKLTVEEEYTKDSMEHFRTPKGFFNSFCDIVTETWYEPKLFHITEKTLRSVAFFKPFLVLSCAGFHTNYLSSYIGLKLYDEVFDYRFDYTISLEGRVRGIIKNIKMLEKMSQRNLEETYNALIPKLIYNKSRIVDLLYDKRKIVPKAFQFLLGDEEVKLYGMYENYFFGFLYDLGWTKQKLI